MSTALEEPSMTRHSFPLNKKNKEYFMKIRPYLLFLTIVFSSYAAERPRTIRFLSESPADLETQIVTHSKKISETIHQWMKASKRIDSEEAKKQNALCGITNTARRPRKEMQEEASPEGIPNRAEKLTAIRSVHEYEADSDSDSSDNSLSDDDKIAKHNDACLIQKLMYHIRIDDTKLDTLITVEKLLEDSQIHEREMDLFLRTLTYFYIKELLLNPALLKEDTEIIIPQLVPVIKSNLILYRKFVERFLDQNDYSFLTDAQEEAQEEEDEDDDYENDYGDSSEGSDVDDDACCDNE